MEKKEKKKEIEEHEKVRWICKKKTKKMGENKVLEEKGNWTRNIKAEHKNRYTCRIFALDKEIWQPRGRLILNRPACSQIWMEKVSCW